MATLPRESNAQLPSWIDEDMVESVGMGTPDSQTPVESPPSTLAGAPSASEPVQSYATPDDQLPSWAKEASDGEFTPEASLPSWAKEEVPPVTQAIQQGDANRFSLGDLAIGVGIESAGGIASNIAGAALATALAPVTGGLSLAIYGGVSFIGGFLSSYAAQKSTGDGRFRVGSALVSGVANTILPGGGAIGSRVAATGAQVAKQSLGTVAKREATRGAIFATADTTATAILDEGRMPTMSELGASGLVGSVVGGTGGTALTTFANSYKKIAGKTAREIDDAIAGNRVTPDDVVNVVTRGTNDITPAERVALSTEIAKAADATDVSNAADASSVLDKLNFADVLNRTLSYIAPSARAPREVVEGIRAFNNNVNAAKYLGSMLKRRVNDFHGGDMDVVDKINRYLDGGDLDPSLLPIADDLALYRSRKNTASERLVQQLNELDVNKMSQESKDALIAEINSGIDGNSYVNRTYRLFEDSKYTFSEKDKDAAIDEIAQNLVFQDEMRRNAAKSAAARSAVKVRTREESLKEAREHVENLIRDSARNQDVNRQTGIGRASEKGIIKQRTNPGPAERRFLGEEIDPGERIMNTISKQAALVERIETNKIIKDSLVKHGLAGDSHTGERGYALSLLGEGNTGLWADDSVARAINTLYTNANLETQYSNAVTRSFADVWSGLSSASKGVKVVLNTPAYMTNLVSGLFFSMNQGISFLTPKSIYRNMSNLTDGFKIAMADLRSVDNFIKKNPQKRAEVLQQAEEMTMYGIKDANVVVEDIRSASRFGGSLSKRLSRTIEGPATVYSALDTSIRYMAWRHNIDMVSSITKNQNLDDRTIKTLAAEITNNSYNNYGYVNPNIKWLSSRGGLNPFVVFMAETTRNIFQQVKVSQSMLRGQYFKQRGINLDAAGLAAERKEGARRAAYFIGVMGAGYAGVRSFNALSGVDGEKENAIREMLIPDWDKNEPLTLHMGEDGKSVTYANATYIMPQLIYARAIELALGDGDPRGALEFISGQFFGDPQVLMAPTIQAFTNVDDRGRPISRSSDAFESAAERTGYVVNEAFTPGVFREANRALKASRSGGDETITDVGLRQLGARVNKINIEDASVFTIRGELDNIRAYRSDYTRARDFQKPSPEQLNRIYAESNAKYREGYETMIRYNKNMDILGLDENARIAVMKRAGLSGSDILNILEGRVNDIPREPRVTTASIYDTLPAGRKERREAIQQIAKDNRKLGMDLLRMEEREQKDSRLDITNRESLIKNLSVAEKTKRIMESNDPRTTLREWQRKGLASTSVTREVQDALRSQPISI